MKNNLIALFAFTSAFSVFLAKSLLHISEDD